MAESIGHIKGGCFCEESCGQYVMSLCKHFALQCKGLTMECVYCIDVICIGIILVDYFSLDFCGGGGEGFVI